MGEEDLPALLDRVGGVIGSRMDELFRFVEVVHRRVTDIVDRVYVLRNGSIVLEESGAEAQQRESWWDLF